MGNSSEGYDNASDNGSTEGLSPRAARYRNREALRSDESAQPSVAASSMFDSSSVVTRLLTGVSASSLAFVALCLSSSSVDSRIRVAAMAAITVGVFASVSNVIVDRVAEYSLIGGR